MATTVVVPQYPGVQQQTFAVPIQNVQTTNVSTANTGTSVRYNKQAGLVTGILQLVVAGIEILTTSIALILGTDYSAAWGIWASIFFYGVAGILGVISKNSSHGVIIGYLVMSILCTMVAPCHMIYDAVASSYGGDFSCSVYYFYGDYSCDKSVALGILHAISAITAAVEIVLAIVASAYCCGGGICGSCCYTSSPTTTQTVIVQHQQPPPIQLVNQSGYPQGAVVINPSYPAAQPQFPSQGSAVINPSYPAAQPHYQPQGSAVINPPWPAAQPQNYQQGPPPAYEVPIGQATAPPQQPVYQELIK